MASSNPYLVSADIPSEAQPGNTFTIAVTAAQGDGGDPWLSSGSCTSTNLDPTGWVTPVTLWVDGEKVDEETLCLANNNQRETTLTLSLSEGSHSVAVKTHPVGDVYPIGESWRTNLDEVADEMTQTVTVNTEASDPSRDSDKSGWRKQLEKVAGQLGTSVQALVLGAVAAVALLVVI